MPIMVIPMSDMMGLVKNPIISYRHVARAISDPDFMNNYKSIASATAGVVFGSSSSYSDQDPMLSKLMQNILLMEYGLFWDAMKHLGLNTDLVDLLEGSDYSVVIRYRGNLGDYNPPDRFNIWL